MNTESAFAQTAEIDSSPKEHGTEGLKSVAIIIVCRNEEKYIGRCLDSLLANDYPKEMIEIVVVDGMSIDRTREIVLEYSRKYPFIRMIDNSRKIKPVALNIGIKSTKSDIVMRIDAHSIYGVNYISKLIEGLYKYNADNIGGVRETDHGGTLLSKAIGIVISHPFAVGNAYWRIGTREVRNVVTVFCGCYRREVFDRIGYFNENLIRTQDREFNERLKKYNGATILDPLVKCVYFPRTRIKDYLKWNYAGAYWLNYAGRFTETKMTSWRNLIPPFFVGWHISLLFAPFLPLWSALTIILPVLAYWGLATLFSFKIALEHKSIGLVPLMVFLFAATHYLYGLGSIIGGAKALIQGKDISR